MKKTMILVSMALAMVFFIAAITGCASTPMAAEAGKVNAPSASAVQGAITAKTATIAANASIEENRLMADAQQKNAEITTSAQAAAHVLSADAAAAIG